MVKTSKLTKQYNMQKHSVTALDNFSIEITEGETVAVMGRSGSGKSTLLNLLGGVDSPTSGKVYINGTEISSLSNTERAIFRRDNIGFVFQGYNLIQEMSALDNIMLPALLKRSEPQKEYFNQIIQKLDIEDRLMHLPSELSGGQQQRIAIARAIINKPSVLLCDEPTGNLDSRSSEDVISLLLEISQEYKITLIVVTHDEIIARRMQRLITISDGRVGE